MKLFFDDFGYTSFKVAHDFENIGSTWKFVIQVKGYRVATSLRIKISTVNFYARHGVDIYPWNACFWNRIVKGKTRFNRVLQNLKTIASADFLIF